MRFMMIVLPKGYDTAPADAMPDPEAVGAMDKYNNELLKAGVVLAMEGLHPPSTGVRVTFPGGKPQVKDGPFPEAKEVVGGFAIERTGEGSTAMTVPDAESPRSNVSTAWPISVAGSTLGVA